jgi:hypothetical protein
MSIIQKDPLRELTQQEERALQKLAKSTSERMDIVKRATALLSVRAGKSYLEAAKVAGYKSNDTISQLVSRFNQRGLPALSIAAGRGRKSTYTSAQQACILLEVQRKPDHKEDQTGTWSLMTLRKALRKSGLPHLGAETIRQVLAFRPATAFSRRARGVALATRYVSVRVARCWSMTRKRWKKKSNRVGVRARRGCWTPATQRR